MAIDRDLGRRSPPMRSPGTIDDRARDIAPDGVPFNFYDSGRMDPPSRRFPMPTPPRMPMPMPMPMPSPGPRQPMPMPLPPPREGLPPRPMPMPPPSVPPGMGPFRQQPFLDQMPRGRQGIMSDLMDMNPDMTGFQMFAQPAAATIDPSDYRTILKMIEQGLDPEDYMNRGGIASLLQ
jgi:hypothetical protein